MTVKSFFKSNAFKCVITLLCVLLVSGIFLTIAYGFLEVTDEDRENRSIEKIYGGSASISQTLDPSSYSADNIKVEKGYVMSDGNYLIKTTGYGGYNGGSVTCWVVVKVTNKAVSGVGKVVIDGQTGQTLMSQYNDKTLDVFSANYANGKEFDRSVITGATAKMTNAAITNAVNGSIAYVKTALGGGSVVEKTPFDDFKFIQQINTKETTVDFADGKLTYTIKTKGYGGVADPFTIEIVVDGDKKIESYTIKVNGSTEGYDHAMPKLETILVGKDLSYFTGLYGEEMNYKGLASYDDSSVTMGASADVASNSTYLCMYAGAFATANYDNALALGLKYTKNLNMEETTWKAEDDKVTYTIKTKGYGGVADPFTIEIVVDSDKKIESYTIKVNGSTEGYDHAMPKLETILVGKDLSYFTGLYGEEMNYKGLASYDDSGVTMGASADIASNSTYLCMYAGAFATANYDLALLTGGNANE